MSFFHYSFQYKLVYVSLFSRLKNFDGNSALQKSKALQRYVYSSCPFEEFPGNSSLRDESLLACSCMTIIREDVKILLVFFTLILHLVKYN